MANYGKVALAFSGSSSYTERILDRGKQVNLSFDQNSRGYHRDHSRPAPYNVIGNPKELLARAGGSVKPADIGFRYGPAAEGGKAATSVSASGRRHGCPSPGTPSASSTWSPPTAGPT